MTARLRRGARDAAGLMAQAFRRPPAAARPATHDRPSRLVLWVERHAPRRAMLALSVVLVGGSVAFGVARGGHIDAIAAALDDVRNAAANAVGFDIASVAIAGNRQLSHDEILAIGGVNGRSSLLFLDAATVRDRLKASPWIADAAVLKLYPGHLRIDVTERRAFALWQRDGQLAVIAEDGAVLDSYVTRRFVSLPLVVGHGAQTQARDFLALVARYPTLKPRVKAAVYVGERRWNLRLDNGLDIRLPEHDVGRALEKLVRLDREQRLFSRDITVVDLRLPDRVTVRLSEEAAKARAEALDRDRKAKRKAGNA